MVLMYGWVVRKDGLMVGRDCWMVEKKWLDSRKGRRENTWIVEGKGGGMSNGWIVG